jgi:hypothetical protein
MPKIKIQGLPKHQTKGPTYPGTIGFSSQPLSLGNDASSLQNGFSPFNLNTAIDNSMYNASKDLGIPDCGEGATWDPINKICKPKEGFTELNNPITGQSSFITEKFNYTPQNKAIRDAKEDSSKKLRNPWLKNLGKAALAIGDTLATTIGVGEALTRHFIEKPEMEKWFQNHQRRNMFTGMVGATDRGDIQTNTYKQAPNLGGQGFSFKGMYGKYGGEFANTGTTKKIMIENVPEYVKMAYGGQTKYGLNISRTDSPYGAKSKTDTPASVTDSVSEIKNGDYKLEAEQAEKLWVVGNQELYNIGGDKHYNGGTKLTAEQVDSDKKPEVPSFIFSEKLRLPKEIVKNEFNITTNKKISPAKLASKFPLNNYKAQLESQHSDSIDKNTAQLMLDKNTKNLAKLSIIHETLLKGEAPPENAVAILGGQLPAAQYGGYIFDKYQTKGQVTPGQPIEIGRVSTGYASNFQDLKDILMSDENKGLRDEIYQRYAKAHPDKKITQDEYVNNILNMQEQLYAFESLGDDYLNKEEWNWTSPRGGSKLGDEDWSGKSWRNAMYNKTAKDLGFTPLNDEQLGSFQEAYRDLIDAAEDPKFKSTWGKYFVTKPTGKAPGKSHIYRGKPVSTKDYIVGTATNREKLTVAKEKPITITVPEEKPKQPERPKATKYICVPDERGNGTVRPSPTGIGYDTPEEAQANCGKAKLPPFDYTRPAKEKMLASFVGAPIYELPFNPNIAGKKQKYWFNDWQAAAQQAFATQYKAPMEMLTAYTAPQGLGSMASSLSGQVADLIGSKIIPGVGQANVGIGNQAEAQNAEEARRVELFNVGQSEKRRAGEAIAKQQYNNALRDYVNNIVDVRGLAQVERGDLYDTNMLTNYYKDPFTLKTIFKGGPGNIFGAGYSFPGSTSGSNSYASLYKQNFDALDGTDMTPEERRKEAMWMTRKSFGDDDDEYETKSSAKSKKSKKNT